MLWLGSSIGNLEPEEALQFFRDILRIGGSQTQVGLAPCQPWLICNINCSASCWHVHTCHAWMLWVVRCYAGKQPGLEVCGCV